MDTATSIRVIPKKDKGKGAIVPLDRKKEDRGVVYSFIYQRDTYVLDGESPHGGLSFERRDDRRD